MNKTMSEAQQSFDERFPTLSLAERDRRYEKVRELLDKHDLDALVLVGGGRDKLDRYLAKEAIAGAVVFPREGDPTLICRFNVMPLLRFDEAGKDTERWIEDLRHGPLPKRIGEALRSTRADQGRVGIIGLTSYSGGNITLNVILWNAIQAELPEVTWMDVARDFEKMMLVKSPEEIRLVRRAAQLGEDASLAFLEAAKEGALESEVGAAATYAITSQGGHEVPPGMLLRSGSKWLIGPPEWGYSGEEPRRLRRGDLIGSELFACYGGYETQQQMHVFIGEPDAETLRRAATAQLANEVGAAMLKPGALFSEVYTAMQEVVLDAGLWIRGPLVQTVGPVFINSPMVVGPETQPELQSLPVPEHTPAEDDFEVQEGMTFALQSCANDGLSGMCLGGSVLIGANGAEELNTLARKLQVND